MPTNFVSHSAHWLTVPSKYTLLSSPESSLSPLDSSANMTSSSTSDSELDSGNFTDLFLFKLHITWACFFTTLLSSAFAACSCLCFSFSSHSFFFLSSFAFMVKWYSSLKIHHGRPCICAPPILEDFAFGVASISSTVSFSSTNLYFFPPIVRHNGYCSNPVFGFGF